MKSIFITGTDTGVGKTLVGGAIARALSQSGRKIGVLKPFETGCTGDEKNLVAADALFLKQMADCLEDINTICPYRMRHPLAPAVAASLESIQVDLDHIQAIFSEMQQRYDIVLVEGAGGLMVPLAENILTADLVKTLQLPLIIVSRLSLGTINHTLLTVRQAQAEGLNVAGIVLNQMTPEMGLAEQTNPHVIQTYTGVSLLGRIPFVPRELRTDADHLARLANEYIELSRLIV